MTKHAPPVPPENRPLKGGQHHGVPSDGKAGPKGGNRNLEQQGRQGDIHENTHNQGHQQDR